MELEKIKRKMICEVMEDALIIESQTLTDLASTMPLHILLEVVQIIGESDGNIFISGCGTSGAEAKKIAHSFNCIEKPAFYLNPADTAHGDLGAIRKDDIVILISKGGNTEELVHLLHFCKRRGTKLIAVTEDDKSLLGREADYLIQVKVEREADIFNMLATANALAVLAIFDAIIVGLMVYSDYSKERFAAIHPGGAVGERLRKGLNSTAEN